MHHASPPLPRRFRAAPGFGALLAAVLAAGAARPGVAAESAATAWPDAVLAVVTLNAPDAALPGLTAFAKAAVRDTDFAAEVLPGDAVLTPRSLLGGAVAACWTSGPLHMVLGNDNLAAPPHEPPYALLLTLPDDEAARAKYAAAGLYLREPDADGFRPVATVRRRLDLETFRARLRDPAAAPDADPVEPEHADSLLRRLPDGRALLAPNTESGRRGLRTLGDALAGWTPAAGADGVVARVELNLGATFAKYQQMIALGAMALPAVFAQGQQMLDRQIDRLHTLAERADEEELTPEAAAMFRQQAEAVEPLRVLRRYLGDLSPVAARYAGELVGVLPHLGRVQAEARAAADGLRWDVVWTPAAGSSFAAMLRPEAAPPGASIASALPRAAVVYAEGMYRLPPPGAPAFDVSIRVLRDLAKVIAPQGDYPERGEAYLRRLMAALDGVRMATANVQGEDEIQLLSLMAWRRADAAALGGLLEEGMGLWAEWFNLMFADLQVPARIRVAADDLPAAGGAPAGRRLAWTMEEAPGLDSLAMVAQHLPQMLEQFAFAWRAGDDLLVAADPGLVEASAAGLVAGTPGLAERPGFLPRIPGEGEGADDPPAGVNGAYLPDLIRIFGRVIGMIAGDGRVWGRLADEIEPGAAPVLWEHRTREGEYAARGYLSAEAARELLRIAARYRVLAAERRAAGAGDGDVAGDGGEVEEEVF